MCVCVCVCMYVCLCLCVYNFLTRKKIVNTAEIYEEVGAVWQLALHAICIEMVDLELDLF